MIFIGVCIYLVYSKSLSFSTCFGQEIHYIFKETTGFFNLFYILSIMSIVVGLRSVIIKLLFYGSYFYEPFFNVREYFNSSSDSESLKDIRKDLICTPLHMDDEKLKKEISKMQSQSCLKQLSSIIFHFNALSEQIIYPSSKKSPAIELEKTGS